MRTTLTIDDDVAALLQKELRTSGEPLKQAVNRLLRSGLQQSRKPAARKRFVVKPLNLGTTREQWARWGETKIEDILEEAERS